MCSRREKQQMAQRLGDVIGLLRAEHVTNTVDRPIDEALGPFVLNPESYASRDAFLDTLAQCVQLVYAQGLLVPRKLTEEQAKTEALHLVESSYQSPNGARGFSAALVRVQIHGPEGVKEILDDVLTSIIGSERQKYVSWVLGKYVQALDWHEKCLMVKVIFEGFGDFFDSAITGSPPERFADCCQDLVLTIVNTLDSMPVS